MVLSLTDSAAAWSSTASRTQADLKSLAAAFEVFKRDAGHYPDPGHYWLELEHKDVRYHRDQSGPLKDRWDRPVIYRLPGKQGDFDLYSVGPDGVDNKGGLDDVSETGVNDGFHWKATWPMGRLTLRLGLGLALGVCLLGLIWPWRFVMPVAGMILCAGIMIGCRLLMHPGVVHSRNQPLQLNIFLAALVFGVLLCGLAVCIWKRHFAKNRPSPPVAAT
jgi:hypothetical protein